MTDLRHDTPAERRASSADHAPYEAAIAGNFEMSVHTGRLIASLGRPRYVEPEAASHMRDDDVVIGLVHNGEARAYPFWIIDYYHVVNDTHAGDPVIIASCERCQTGAAFLARLDGHRLRLYAAGMYNATLMLREPPRPGADSAGVWIHYEGACVSGPHRGRSLPILPTYHMTWEAWRRSHPDTVVLAAPDDPRLPDSRDGHGREEYFSRPGVERALVDTIVGSLDRRYAENEMILGLHVGEETRAYPLQEVKAAGRIVHDEVGGDPVVVFAGPGQDEFAMACYSRTVEGRPLTFELGGGGFVDRETGTAWSIEGAALEGPLAGRRLQPLPWCFLRWHAWVYFHPATALYRGTRSPYPEARHVDTEAFAPLLAGLERLGRPIEMEDGIVRPRLPLEGEAGLRVVVGEDPLNLYRFRSAAAAADWVAFEGARSCRPIYAKLDRKRFARVGRMVVESDPATQYADPTQIVRLPDLEVPWSDVVEDPAVVARWAEGLDDEPPAGPSFCGLFAHLESAGFEILEVAVLPAVQLRPGTRSAVAAVIEGDPFEVFLCSDDAAARTLAESFERALAVGSFVFRSAPRDRFHDMTYEVGRRPVERIEWSELVEDPELARAAGEYAAAVEPATLGSRSSG